MPSYPVGLCVLCLSWAYFWCRGRRDSGFSARLYGPCLSHMSWLRISAPTLQHSVWLRLANPYQYMYANREFADSTGIKIAATWCQKYICLRRGVYHFIMRKYHLFSISFIILNIYICSYLEWDLFYDPTCDPTYHFVRWCYQKLLNSTPWLPICLVMKTDIRTDGQTDRQRQTEDNRQTDRRNKQQPDRQWVCLWIILYLPV